MTIAFLDHQISAGSEHQGAFLSRWGWQGGVDAPCLVTSLLRTAERVCGHLRCGGRGAAGEQRQRQEPSAHARGLSASRDGTVGAGMAGSTCGSLARTFSAIASGVRPQRFTASGALSCT